MNGQQKKLIRPNSSCRMCNGRGTLAGSTVEAWGTEVQLPVEWCDCILEQIEDGDDLNNIELDIPEYPDCVEDW